MTNKQFSMIKNTKFVSECWTIYKLAILQNHADYKKWLINHLNNLTMTKNYWRQFGLDGERQNFQMVYGDLLDIEEFNIYNLKNQRILISFIKKSIDSKYYVLIDCWSACVYQMDKFQEIQEILIYGYNFDEKILSGFYYSTEKKKNCFLKITFDKIFESMK